MKSIRKRCIGYCALSAACVLLTVWFITRTMPAEAFLFGVVSVVLLFFLCRQYRQLYYAKLIAIPSAIITKDQNAQEVISEETIISTFGILVGGKVHKWGCDGRFGTRLEAIEIDKAYITLTFGDEARKIHVKLLHGLTDAQAVSKVKQQLWHETGVDAAICDWQ